MKPLLQSIKNNQTVHRFVGVGIANTLIDFVILFILQHFGIIVIIANLISTSVAFCFSFYANKRFTFKTTGTNLRREMLLFVIVTLTGMWVLQNIIIAIILPLLAIYFTHTTALLFAKILATACSMIWNYLFYKNLVFRRTAPGKEQ